MSKKKILAPMFTSALLASLIIVSSLANLANANFVVNPRDYDPQPTIPPAHQPTITIENPQNITYHSNNIQLRIVAATSQLNIKAELNSITYYLDGKAHPVLNSTHTIGPPSYTYYENLNLTEGKHSLQAIASARNWNNNYYDAGSVIALYGPATKGTSEIVNFEVDSPNSTPEPIPTSSQSPIISYSPSPAIAPTLEPTAAPTLLPKPQTGFLGTSLPVEYGYALVAAVIALIGASFMVLHSRRAVHSRSLPIRQETNQTPGTVSEPNSGD